MGFGRLPVCSQCPGPSRSAVGGRGSESAAGNHRRITDVVEFPASRKAITTELSIRAGRTSADTAGAQYGAVSPADCGVLPFSAVNAGRDSKVYRISFTPCRLEPNATVF